MSDTPRTDAEEREGTLRHGPAGIALTPREGGWVTAIFARELEREVTYWKRMHECAQNANALRQGVIEGGPHRIKTTAAE